MKALTKDGRLRITPRELIDALKSGNYKQGHGALVAYGAFCCLGVAADQCNIDWKSQAPDAFARWEDESVLGEHARPHWMNPRMELDLMHLNDDDESGKFEKPIAYLEEYIKGRGK